MPPVDRNTLGRRKTSNRSTWISASSSRCQGDREGRPYHTRASRTASEYGRGEACPRPGECLLYLKIRIDLRIRLRVAATLLRQKNQGECRVVLWHKKGHGSGYTARVRVYRGWQGSIYRRISHTTSFQAHILIRKTDDNVTGGGVIHVELQDYIAHSRTGLFAGDTQSLGCAL